MKLHLMIATLALTACSVAQAEYPPAPWERIDFNCRQPDSSIIEGHSFYRNGDSFSHEHHHELVGGSIVWRSTPNNLMETFTIEGTYKVVVAKIIDRATGYMAIYDTEQGRTDHQCEIRTANKF